MNVILTCDIDKSLYDIDFVAYEANIWYATLYIASEDEEDSFWVDGFGGNLDGISNDRILISSMYVGNTVYSRVISIEDLRSLSEDGFYYDYENQTIYVKFTSTSPWYLNSPIRLGRTFRYTSKAQNDSSGRPTNSIIGDFKSEVRLLDDSVSIGRVEDDLKNNKMVFSGFSFSLINDDGSLDNIRQDVINLGSRIRMAKVENGVTAVESDFIVVRNGYIENVTFPDDKVSLVKCSDPRAIFTQKINNEFLNQTDYPDLDDRLVDKRIPIVIGSVKNIPTVRLEATDLVPPAGSTWTTNNTIRFLAGTVTYGDFTSFEKVYITGSLYWRDATVGKWIRESYEDYELSIVSTPTTTGECSVDLTTGEITVWGFAGGKITTNCTGFIPGVSSPQDVISEHLMWFLNEFASLLYTESFFWTSEVADVLSRSNGYTGGYYIGTDGETLKKIVDDLASSVNIRLTEKEDRYTLIDEYVPSQSTMSRIYNWELEETPSRDYDTDRYMSSILVKYNKDWTKKEFATKLDDSDEADAIKANSLSYTYEFETNLDNETDAIAISDERYDISPPLHLDIKFSKHIEYELYEYVKYELQRRNGTLIGEIVDSVYRIVEINKKAKTARLRYIEDVT